MSAGLLLLMLVQAPCSGADLVLAAAAGRAVSFAPQEAEAILEGTSLRMCPTLELAWHYLRGLNLARAAYDVGGSSEALAPVWAEIGALEELSGGQPGRAEIARLVLRAAAAAAQSERDEMAAFLAQATSMESLQLAAGQPAAPLLPALEAAGDLWMRVDRYDDARTAYERAAGALGATPRITLGLARAAARLGDHDIACYQFRSLLVWWGSRDGDTPEIAEARRYVRERACGS